MKHHVTRTIGIHVCLVGGSSFFRGLGHLIVGMLQGVSQNNLSMNLLDGGGCYSMVRTRMPSKLEMMVMGLSGPLCSMAYTSIALWNFWSDLQVKTIGSIRIAEQFFVLISHVFSEVRSDLTDETIRHTMLPAINHLYVLSFLCLFPQYLV